MEKELKLKDILAIAGQPGLFKFVARSSNGVIVESLSDHKRMNATGTAKVSSMAEIAIYTYEEDMPINEVFTNLYNHTGGKAAISHKSEPQLLKALIAEVIPEYDRERVHVSDMKKVVMWFNALVEAGMTDFTIDEPEQEAEEA